MIRKLIQLSPSTAVVSLPSTWIKANKLKKGASIFINEEENKIIISAESKKTEKEITLDISKLKDKLMWSAIDAVYIAGYDSIILSTKDAEQSALMTKIVRYFPGMIIYEEKKNHVHFKSMGENTEDDIDKILSRIFNLNISMIEDGIEEIKSKEWLTLSKMKYRDYNINTYISYFLRHINKFGYKKFSKTAIIHTYVKILEMMSDKLAALFVTVGQKEIKIDTKVITLIFEMYNNIRTIHFKFDQDLIIELDNKRNELTTKIKDSFPIVLPYLMEITELFYELEELELQLQV